VIVEWSGTSNPQTTLNPASRVQARSIIRDERTPTACA